MHCTVMLLYIAWYSMQERKSPALNSLQNDVLYYDAFYHVV